MQEKDAQRLLDKYRAGECTEEEKIRLRNWFHTINAELPTALSREELEATGNEMWAELEAQTKPAPVRRLWPRLAAAASIIAILSAGSYLLLHKQQQPIAQVQKNDVQPGRNQATLTLANGKQIILTKGLSGQLATQGNMQIKVNAGNAIAYIPQNTNTATEVVYNTLSTVRGQESPYPLVLSDGTKVWLNAESSITYPIAFNGKERSVKITGEAYFEVVHNTVQPFKVEVKGQTIEDIGTAFNINAYDDEPNMKTTLISGSVKINSSTVLHPGQQAIQSGPAIRVKDVDTEGAIAWKNGYFLFDYESLESIMRRISRWYNVDVAYEPGQQITTGFLGSMTRYTNVSEVLNALEAAGKVKFKIEGRKITVSKK